MNRFRNLICVFGMIATSTGVAVAQETWDPTPTACKTPLCDPLGPYSEPKVQFTLDLLILGRTNVDRNDLLFDTRTQNVLLRNDDMLSKAETGGRFAMNIFGSEGGSLEFVFLGMNEFGDKVTVSNPDPITFPFFGGVPVNPGNEYSVKYRSRFNSGELNLKHNTYSRLNLLAGLRMVDLNERFRITDTGGGYFSSTDNDLYGFQLGGDLRVANIKQSVIFSTLKAGVFYNDAEVRARAADSNNNPLGFYASDDHAAFVGDLALGMLIPMGPAADLRLAYQGIYLDGVGLAPDQSSNFSIFNGAGSLNPSTVFYHGGFIGFDLFW